MFDIWHSSTSRVVSSFLKTFMTRIGCKIFITHKYNFLTVVHIDTNCTTTRLKSFAKQFSLVAAEVSEIDGCSSEDGHDTGKIWPFVWDLTADQDITRCVFIGSQSYQATCPVLCWINYNIGFPNMGCTSNPQTMVALHPFYSTFFVDFFYKWSKEIYKSLGTWLPCWPWTSNSM